MSQFRLLDLSMRQYVRGNFVMFGFWGGLRANITLLSPLANLLINWKHRNSHLSFADPETGKELSPLEIKALLKKMDHHD